MPTITTVTGGPLQENTYVVYEEGEKACVLIDPGAEENKIRRAIGRRAVAAILLTHGHFDHMLTVEPWLQEGAKLYIHQKDVPMLSDSRLNMGRILTARLSLRAPDVAFADGERIEEAGLCFDVLHTPGHTPGSSCFRLGDTLFSGDTLFYQCYGRTDLPGGDAQAMIHSLQRLQVLPEQTHVLPGHGSPTRIGWEKAL